MSLTIATKSKEKRITAKLKHPNPLFEKWLVDWRDSAKEKDSKMQYCFEKALQSLRKYPLPLNSGKDCKILNGFGEKLCNMLDQKLAQYKTQNGGVIPAPQVNEAVESEASTKTLKRGRSGQYVPMLNSGGHAILETLYKKSLEPSYPGFLSKMEIIKFAQHISDKSFTRPEPGTFYTAWSSMRTLINKNLVQKKSHPPKFSLTEEGNAVAKKLCAANADYENDPNVSFDINNAKLSQKTELLNTCQSSKSTQSSSSNPMSSSRNNIYSSVKSVESSTSAISSSQEAVYSEEEQIVLSPFGFDVYLLVDKMEISGKVASASDDPIINELIQQSVPFEIRHLKVGDYTWIGKDKVTQKELVLPYIIERKRMDDFSSSIKDGRFHEQKFRLKQSGLQNLIYLVESYGNNTHIGLPLSTLYQAATNTLVQDGFSVKFTENFKETASYLASLTTIIKSIYEPKTLMGCRKSDLVNPSINDDFVFLMTFCEFNHSATKNKVLKVKDLFVRQLLQLKGVSVEKALAIVDKYPNVKSLREAYKSTSPGDGEKLLANLKFGVLNKNIGPVISKTLYDFYTAKSFP